MCVLRLSVLLLCLLASCALAADSMPNPGLCEDYDPSGLIEGNPDVRLAPEKERSTLSGPVVGCLVLIYSLKEQPGSNGATLVPYRIKIVASTESLPNSLLRSAKSSLSKWIFLATTHEASQDRIYFSLFEFEP